MQSRAAIVRAGAAAAAAKADEQEHSCQILICGDDDQCIYGWRAGTVNAFSVCFVVHRVSGVMTACNSECVSSCDC